MNIIFFNFFNYQCQTASTLDNVKEAYDFLNTDVIKRIFGQENDDRCIRYNAVDVCSLNEDMLNLAVEWKKISREKADLLLSHYTTVCNHDTGQPLPPFSNTMIEYEY